MSGARWAAILGCAAALAAAGLAYLHDPPWIGSVTTGLRNWEGDASGTRFRWTNGHASFFVPAEATALTLPLRAVFPGPGDTAVSVKVSVDDRTVAEIALADPQAWVRPELPLPRQSTHRRFRRVDLRVSRTIGSGNRGVELGEISTTGP